MRGESSWCGYHDLRFTVFYADSSKDFQAHSAFWVGEKGWYWAVNDKQGFIKKPKGKFPSARSAFLDAVHSYEWPEGELKKPESKTEDVTVRLWQTPKGPDPWCWAFFKDGHQTGGSYGANSLNGDPIRKALDRAFALAVTYGYRITGAEFDYIKKEKV